MKTPLLPLLGTVTAVFFLWPYPLLYPLKLLVVFFHEASHALMTIATGGRVVELVIDKMQGGHVISSGGSRFFILSAGYLGSLLWGIAIYLLAISSTLDKAITTLLGFAIATLCALFVRDLFALFFASTMAIVLVGIGLKASRSINDFVLRVIGIISMMYVPLDIYSDTIERSNLPSDALMLAQEFGGPSMLWGSAWLAVSLVTLIFTVLFGLRISARTTTTGR